MNDVTVKRYGELLIISIRGSFNFEVHSGFRKAYENIDKEIKKVELDLRDSDYIDSSALGMLLLMKENLKGINNISIKNANDKLKKILEVANFHEIFDVI